MNKISEDGSSPNHKRRNKSFDELNITLIKITNKERLICKEGLKNKEEIKIVLKDIEKNKERRIVKWKKFP